MKSLILLYIGGAHIIAIILLILIILFFRGIIYNKSMKFQLSESIFTHTSKLQIIQSLKNQFQKISNSVFEKDNKLIVRDITASFGFFRHDTSLIIVQE